MQRGNWVFKFEIDIEKLENRFENFLLNAKKYFQKKGQATNKET